MAFMHEAFVVRFRDGQKCQGVYYIGGASRKAKINISSEGTGQAWEAQMDLRCPRT